MFLICENEKTIGSFEKEYKIHWKRKSWNMFSGGTNRCLETNQYVDEKMETWQLNTFTVIKVKPFTVLILFLSSTSFFWISFSALSLRCCSSWSWVERQVFSLRHEREHDNDKKVCEVTQSCVSETVTTQSHSPASHSPACSSELWFLAAPCLKKFAFLH